MDPVSVIVTAVVLGASAGLQDTASQAVKDAYAALKRLFGERYQHVSVTPLESKPESEPKRLSLAEDLTAANANEDAELLEAARRLISAVREHEPTVATARGIDLARLEAEAVRIRDVRSRDTGVHGQDWKVNSEIEITGITAGIEEERRSPTNP
ncbi:hypothetical protein [Geodermatophilus sabuli]|uniref:hypothetical protein n=1 Tax=Geodermatophilus sabuli TaxID=1564158 RepID=UPI001179EB76|nr:hypothetical protein [Geodermatophilus sabuli]MBB3084673.1 hypothetical protein [Geodermatophilus sabuli]